MGSIIAIANQKGGVGKTTTAVNLGASLAADGKRVLIIDIDPQGNASSGVGVQKASVERGLYEALIGRAELAAVIVPTELPNLFVAPATRDLAGASLELAEVEEGQKRLRALLEPLRSQYDYIVIDCPPSLDLLTINGLTASDSILIPVQCEYYAMEGLSDLLSTVDMVRDHLNVNLRSKASCSPCTTRETSRIRSSTRFAVTEDKVFETMIPEHSPLRSAELRSSLHLYDPRAGGLSYLARASSRRCARRLTSAPGITIARVGDGGAPRPSRRGRYAHVARLERPRR